MCLPDLNWAAARKRWGGTGRWNRDRLMRSAFGGVVGAGGDGMSCRDALGGRRDAAGVSGVSLVLLGCSQPRIAAQRAVCGRRAARVRPCVRRGALLPARTGGRAGALLRAPLWPSLGVAQCVAAAGGRSLLSDGMPRVSVPYSPTGLSGRALLTL